MKYKNFDVELYEYQEHDDGGESFSVRVTNSPAGDQSPSQAERVVLPVELRGMAHKFWGRLDSDQAIEFGEALGACLLPASGRQRWSESLRYLEEDEALRLRLKFDAWQVADLPWELIYVARPTVWAGRKGEDGFLALDRRVSIVRYEYTDYPLIPFQPGDDATIRQLVVLSEVKEYDVLDLTSEATSIADSLQSVTNLALEVVEAPTVEALQQALERPVHIFHYAGHGGFEKEMGPRFGEMKGIGILFLAGSDGNATPFPAPKLALNLVRCGVRIACLNTAESATRDRSNRLSGLAPALACAGIPVVIGFTGSIPDRSATLFSRTFYRNLAAGNSVDAAVTNARLAMYTQAGDIGRQLDWSQPVLYLRTDESTLFPIRPRPVKPAQDRSSTLSSLALRQMLVQSFDVDELALLCDDITNALARDGIQQRVDLEIVGGSNLPAYALNLIQHLERRGLLSYLVEAVEAARPKLFQAPEA